MAELNPITNPTALPPAGTPDAQGNYYNAQGQSVAAPNATVDPTHAFGYQAPAPSTTPTTPQDENTTYNNTLDQGHQDYLKTVARIDSGLMTPAEQQIWDMTKATYDSVRDEQLTANKAFEGGTKVLSERRGLTQNAPDLALENIHSAVSEGNKKILEINNQSALALGQLQEAFKQNDLKLATDKWTEYQSWATKKHEAFAEQQKAVQDAAKQLQDQKHQELMDNLAVNEFDYKQTQDKIDNAFKQQQITLDEKKQLQDQQHQNIQDKIGMAELALKQGEFNATYGGNNPDGTQMTAKDIPGVRTTNQGISYFDPTQFSDAKQRKAAENIARQAGVPILSDKTDTEAMTNLDGALQNLATLEQMFNNLAPGNTPGAALWDKGENVVGGIFSHTGIYTTDRQAEIQAYNSNRDQLFKQIYALAGGHPRINSVELQQAANALPRLTITSMDTGKTGQTKLNLTRHYLYNALKAIVPSANLPQSGDKIFQSTDELLTAHPDRAGQAAKLAKTLNPTTGQPYSDDEIRVILNY